ncbi:MAG: D-alanine--D-alanine ligase [Acidimicrobiia bacterium]|nr:D-alanine--D-alanine ligase [Acidimicrobiia bacterium]MDH5521671.1 D-alanine--D-alanine ligase [Acidimicrobiia bacterium]
MTSESSPPIRLLVLFGGQSAEHDVSCTTAAHVLAAVDRTHYDIEAIGITRTGQFVTAADAVALLPPASDGAEPSQIKALEPIGDSTELMATVHDGPADARVVVLPLLHGPLGEDGTVQGLCELADVAYVGAGVLGSAVTMDKAMAKTVLDAAGLPQTRWRSVSEAELRADRDAVVASLIDDLGLPCFVKPANMGSSIGVGKASSAGELAAALDAAFVYDELAVVEESVVAREIELSVLGNHDLDVSVPGEIVPGAEFYDYEDKYHDGNAKLIIPAELPDGVAEQLQDLARRAYRTLRVEGMARADFLYEEGGRGPLINELNTIPGFTPISMYPKLWEASGLGYSELIDRLVDLAIERHERRSAKRYTGRTSRSGA